VQLLIDDREEKRGSRGLRIRAGACVEAAARRLPANAGLRGYEARHSEIGSWTRGEGPAAAMAATRRPRALTSSHHRQVHTRSCFTHGSKGYTA